ncbi:hypothetical protein [Aliiroseovarius subalbicans]|uniref:hypothetical protein n=1 Tax=Aliiroseovarius subalbicans TaxID=2925840 RepID=UPI001F56A887|nr:hypothetical protein [Aliiroseovarius subalbicans]MCI2400474.1 hypothetical protein [Aliiroseovarius subalbicans]
MDKSIAALMSRVPAAQLPANSPAQPTDLSQKISDLMADRGPMGFAEIMKGETGLKGLVPLLQEFDVETPKGRTPDQPSSSLTDQFGFVPPKAPSGRPAAIAERPDLQSAPLRETPFDAGDFTPPAERDGLARLSPGALFAGTLAASPDTTGMTGYGRLGDD